jgi:hypothetical protein
MVVAIQQDITEAASADNIRTKQSSLILSQAFSILPFD